MKRTRPLFSLLLAIAVIASSLTMAVARGRMATTSERVICSGYAAVTVTVDAKGNPVQTVHPCPDCLAAHLTVVLTDAPGLVCPVTASRALGRCDGRFAQGETPPQATARGPPLTV